VEGEPLISRNAIFLPTDAWEIDAKPTTGASDELIITEPPSFEKEAFNNLPAFRSLLNEYNIKVVDVWKLGVFSDQAGPIEIWALPTEDHADLRFLLNVTAARAKQAKKDCTRIEGHSASGWWRAHFVLKKLFNHQVGPRYAVTTHKSQGGQWDSVFVDVPDMQYLRKNKPAEYPNLLYTAVTRASRNLHILEN
jgi:hypothetical protein